MKINLEIIPDSAMPAPEAKVAPAPTTLQAPSTPRTMEEKQTKAAEVKQAPKISEEKPSPQPPAASSSSSGNFAHQGGIPNTSDPDRDNPHVYHYSYTEEKR